MPLEFAKPVVGFAAHSGTGKTTLLKQLVPVLRARGIRVAVIKHAHHEFDTDRPDKDSYELRKAGATQMLVASSRRWALITENAEPQEPQLTELLRHIDGDAVDLVLVEGFKREPFPKIELHRSARQRPLQFLSDPSIVAVACDQAAILPGTQSLAVLDINAPEQIADFIEHRFLTEERA